MEQGTGVVASVDCCEQFFSCDQNMDREGQFTNSEETVYREETVGGQLTNSEESVQPEETVGDGSSCNQHCDSFLIAIWLDLHNKTTRMVERIIDHLRSQLDCRNSGVGRLSFTPTEPAPCVLLILIRLRNELI